MKNQVTIVYISLKVHVAQRVGRVGFGSGQTGYRSKTGHFKRVKNGFGSIGFWVRLTCIFHMIFFFFLKKTDGKGKVQLVLAQSSMECKLVNGLSSIGCKAPWKLSLMLTHCSWVIRMSSSKLRKVVRIWMTLNTRIIYLSL